MPARIPDDEDSTARTPETVQVPGGLALEKWRGPNDARGPP